MSSVIAAPEMMTAAATDLATIGSNVSAAHMVAAARTTSVIPAAADEVSAGIAQVFSRAAQEYQGLAGQAAAFNQKFVQHLSVAAGSYAAAEAANAALLQPLTAGAGAIGSAIGALPGQLLNLFSAAMGQLFNDVIAFVGSNPVLQTLVNIVLGAFAWAVVFAVLLFIVIHQILVLLGVLPPFS